MSITIEKALEIAMRRLGRENITLGETDSAYILREITFETLCKLQELRTETLY